jgi:hypothetical protein
MKWRKVEGEVKSFSEQNQPAHVLIATPAYGCIVHTDYLHSVIGIMDEANRNGFLVTVVTIGNNSLITHARNDLISFFVQEPQFTHMLFLDADIGLPRGSLTKLLSRNVGVIGVPIPLKGFSPNGEPVITCGKIFMMDDSGLASVEYINTAVLLIEKHIAEKICKLSNTYHSNPAFRRGGQLTETSWDVFRVGTGLIPEWYLPEDFYFCYRLRMELGVEIYADFSIPVSHCGMYEFRTTPEFLRSIVDKFFRGSCSESMVANSESE